MIATVMATANDKHRGPVVVPSFIGAPLDSLAAWNRYDLWILKKQSSVNIATIK